MITQIWGMLQSLVFTFLFISNIEHSVVAWHTIKSCINERVVLFVSRLCALCTEYIQSQRGRVNVFSSNTSLFFLDDPFICSLDTWFDKHGSIDVGIRICISSTLYNIWHFLVEMFGIKLVKRQVCPKWGRVTSG